MPPDAISKPNILPVRDVIWEGLTRLEEHEYLPQGIRLGYAAVDNLMPGLLPGDFALLASVTGGGKSSLMLNWAASLVQAEKPRAVGIISLDQTPPQLTARMLCCMTELAPCRGFSADNWHTIMRAAEGLTTLPLYFGTTRRSTAADLFAKARQLRRQHGVEVIFIDSLLHVKWLKQMSNSQQRPEDLRGIGLKRLAQELAIPLVALTSLDESHRFYSQRPSIPDLRGHHADLAQYADVVMLLHCAEAQTDTDTVELILAKNRHGPSSVHVPFSFHTGSGKFSEIANPVSV